MKKNKFFISLIVIVMICSILVGGIAWNRENAIFRSQFCIYMQNQYIAVKQNSNVNLSCIIIDGKKQIETVLNEKKVIFLETKDERKIQVDSYEVETIKKSSLTSPYALYKMKIKFEPKEVGKIEIKKLILDTKQLPMGDIIVENIEEQKCNEIISSFSPAQTEGNYVLGVTNNKSKNIEIKAVEYCLDGKEYNALKEPVTIKPNEQKEITDQLQMKDTTNTSICPKVIFSYDDQEYVDMATVTTEYVVSLTKDDVIKYLKNEAKNK